MSGAFGRLGRWLICAVAIGGCDLSDVKDELAGFGDLSDFDASIDLDVDVDAEALRVLSELFPDLSAEELLEIKAELSLEEILALRSELEGVRELARELSDELVTTAAERVQRRDEALADLNGGFPEQAQPVGRACVYSEQEQSSRVQLSGVFENAAAVLLEPAQLEITIDGVVAPFTLGCVHQGESVDVVFLIDITGSMGRAIEAVRDSVVAFVDALETSGIDGTVGVVTFQDSVGIDVTFQEPQPAGGAERSPFFEPVSLSDSDRVQALRNFVNRLEANRGDDLPENLAAAVDFARNNTIGYDGAGQPNVIGEGGDDPAETSPWPTLGSSRQVFVAFTDATFHGDDRSPDNSSLRADFVPRDTAEIAASLQRTGSVVHVVDPSWVDESTDPLSGRSGIDADYWAEQTGGLGEDRVAGYSLVDLELLLVADDTGLLDLTLDRVLQSSCTLELDGALAPNASVVLTLQVEGEVTFDSELPVLRF